jgi:magnesium chelatase family protein
MFVKTFGSTVYGVEAMTITVEVNWDAKGKEYFIVGLPDSAVKESMHRIESAIKSNDFEMPRTKIVVNLAPADVRKSGTAFDLPIAMGVLGASEQMRNWERLQDYLLMGELSLEGEVRPIKGALPIAIQARRDKFRGLIVPVMNAKEAGMVSNLNVYGVSHIREVIDFFEGGERSLHPVTVDIREEFQDAQNSFDTDFSEVKGQEHIKRALEIAAAGGHNVLLIGPPGAGKTMLARRFPSILPPLTLEEAIESTRIHSVAGQLREDHTLVSTRPFRAPHHTISYTALVGGGSIPQPGEISLAHNGVLFLDELPEFQRIALEVMRQPLEERKVVVNRTRSGIEFPASFLLIASMNPCPCGYFNHPDRSCTCPPGAVQKYLSRISGPLLDRIDMHIEVTPMPFSAMADMAPGETSHEIRKRVREARARQSNRFTSLPGIYGNAHMDGSLLRQMVILDRPSSALLRHAMEKLSLSARAHDRILKMSRTIADLAGTENVKAEHVAEAIQYRSLDRDSWGR